MSSKKRWQQLAGISSDAEQEKEPETLNEGFSNFGMATPGVLGNPFEGRMSSRESFEDTLVEMTPEIDQDKVYMGEDEHEGLMAKGQLDRVVAQAHTLHELMPDDAELEGWVQSKLTLAAEMMDVVYHYLLDENPIEEPYDGEWDEEVQHDAHVETHEEHEEEEDLDEGKKKGLWGNIHAKRKRGEKPAKPGDEDYPDKESWDKVTKEGYLDEAEYQGRKVTLNKPTRGDVKKFKVYVKNPKGNVVKVNFGDPDMRIKKSDPKARKSFRARHNCDNPGPKHKARYWSCKKW